MMFPRSSPRAMPKPSSRAVPMMFPRSSPRACRSRAAGRANSERANPRAMSSRHDAIDRAGQRGRRFEPPTIRSTCARETRNCRAIVPGFTPASKAARMTFSCPGGSGNDRSPALVPDGGRVRTHFSFPTAPARQGRHRSDGSGVALPPLQHAAACRAGDRRDGAGSRPSRTAGHNAAAPRRASPQAAIYRPPRTFLPGRNCRPGMKGHLTAARPGGAGSERFASPNLRCPRT